MNSIFERGLALVITISFVAGLLWLLWTAGVFKAIVVLIGGVGMFVAVVWAIFVLASWYWGKYEIDI